jgi:hypothetical protein
VGFSLPTEYKKSPQKSLITEAVKLQWLLSKCLCLVQLTFEYFLKKVRTDQRRDSFNNISGSWAVSHVLGPPGEISAVDNAQPNLMLYFSSASGLICQRR